MPASEMWREFTDTFVKSSVAKYARDAGASEVTADRIGAVTDLAASLSGGFLDDLIQSSVKYTAKAAAQNGGAAAVTAARQLARAHATARLGYQAGGAGIGAAIGGFSKGDGLFDIDGALAGASYGSAAGGLVGAYRVKCFAAGEHVWTESGSQPIETLEVGDLVVSRDENNPQGTLEIKRIEELFCNDGEVYLLKVLDTTIRTTAEHPFYSKERGWTAASDLEMGELIATANGEWAEVQATKATSEVTKLYNFRVSDFHTYFVGERAKGLGIWAHNVYHVDAPSSAAYKNRIDQTPTNGSWSGRRGECTFKSANPETLGLKVNYQNGFANLTPYAKHTVEIDDFVSIVKSAKNPRRELHKLADQVLAERLGVDATLIKRFRSKNQFAWHEVEDMRTLQLVKTPINAKFGHVGGVSEALRK